MSLIIMSNNLSQTLVLTNPPKARIQPSPGSLCHNNTNLQSLILFLKTSDPIISPGSLCNNHMNPQILNPGSQNNFYCL